MIRATALFISIMVFFHPVPVKSEAPEFSEISVEARASELESDEIVGQSDLCEECYKKLTRGELYNYE